MGKKLSVSVLDLVGMRPEETPGRASLAVLSWRNGLNYWVISAIGSRSITRSRALACSATAVLIGHIAGATQTIRVGSGGVMLPNHAPLVVAEQFGTLEALYPGRIDLGLGRAPGGDFATMRALRRDLQQSGDDFPALLAELRDYLGPEQPGQAVLGCSWARDQRPDHPAGLERIQRATGRHAGPAVRLCGAFCS